MRSLARGSLFLGSVVSRGICDCWGLFLWHWDLALHSGVEFLRNHAECSHLCLKRISRAGTSCGRDLELDILGTLVVGSWL